MKSVQTIIDDYRQVDDKVLRDCIPFIAKVANQYWHYNKSMELLDFVNAGICGLQTARKTWKKKRNTKLLTFSYWHIHTAMQDLVVNAQQVSISRRNEQIKNLKYSNIVTDFDEELTKNYHLLATEVTPVTQLIQKERYEEINRAVKTLKPEERRELNNWANHEPFYVNSKVTAPARWSRIRRIQQRLRKLLKA